MRAVAIHCGSSHVKGNAKNCQYFVASIFDIHKCVDGKFVWRNSGVSTHPRRSYNKCLQDATELANKQNALLFADCGSLHNRPVNPIDVDYMQDITPEEKLLV